MTAAPIRLAAAQFPVSGNVPGNFRHIRAQMRKAAALSADVVQFPEAALSGYAPAHVPCLERFDWEQLAAHVGQVQDLAASLGLWVVLGSMRRVPGQRPRICLHVISAEGEIAGTYDKQRLYGREQAQFSAGSDPLVLTINGWPCGFLVCFDNCFPELYDQYRDLGVGLIFHSFHNAANRHPTSINDLMLASLIVRAADNRMWISASNASTPYSPLAACIVRPDGALVRARRNVTGMVIDTYPRDDLGWTYDNRARVDGMVRGLETAPTVGGVGGRVG